MEENTGRKKSGFAAGLLTGIVIMLVISILGFGGWYIVNRNSSGSYTSENVTEGDVSKKLDKLNKLIDKYYLYQDEVDALKIQGVPSVFADGKLLHVGRGEFGELLAKLEAQYGIDETKVETEVKEYDVIVAGGGPAGVSAAIYSARKGLRVAIVAERVGGQVKETVGIENLISVPETTGSELADNLKTHLLRYPVDLLEQRKIEKVELAGKDKLVTTSVGEKFIAPALIIATGASWRKLNVPGENDYIGRGVAFCPHCDGPFYKGKQVAVVGGGNSGIEAAIDLAGICSKVTVFEFMDELKADNVLQERLKSLPNVHEFP